MTRITLLAVALLVSVSAWADAPRDPYQYFFDQTLGDFDEELQTARDEGKQGIMLFFEMDECPFCHRMKEMVFNQPEVQAYFKEHFLIYPVDIDGDVLITDFEGNRLKQKDFAFRDYRVRATPVLMFFDLDGKPVARYTGATADVEEFMWLGQYVVDGVYKDMPFTRYKRERRQSSR
ncbi:MAG: thioredoxin family protein [Gammaproteobacteria bacterium]|nr:thioredoxin family protein [Gammaproteobacteria bacterium]